MKLRFQDYNDQRISLDVEKLGQGMFTKAYTDKQTENVYLVTCDPMKEVYTFVQGTHLPIMDKIGYIGSQEVYKSVLYLPLTKENKSAWEQMKEIKRLLAKIGPTSVIKIEDESIEGLLIPEEMKQNLINLFGWALNYDQDVMLEISPRNLKVGSDGNLILLDIIFSGTKHSEIQKAKRGAR